MSFGREQVKIIIFTELSDEKFHVDGSVRWAHANGFPLRHQKKSHRMV